MRVPLVVHWPGHIPAGRVVGGLAAHVDVVPTLAGLLGMPLLAEPRGRDLSAQLTSDARPDPERAVYLQRRHYEPSVLGHLRLSGPKHAVRWRSWKLVESPQEQGIELFDLAADPGELRNLAGTRPDVERRLREDLAGWRASQVVHTAAPPAPSAEDQERLRALGYVE